MKRRILFFLPEDSVRTNGVYRSQILEFARYLVFDCNYQVLILHKDSNYEDAENFKKVVNSYGIDLEYTLCPNSKISFVFNDFHFRKFKNYFLNCIKQFSPTHIYTRHPQATHIALEIKSILNFKLIYSLRGVSPEEKIMMNNTIKNRIGSYFLQLLENRAVKDADDLNTVSEKFSEYIKYKYKKNSTVLPCCVSSVFLENKQNIWERNKDLGWSKEDIIITYCGSTQKWQHFEEICEFISSLMQLDKKIKFLVISRDIEKTCKIINNFKIESKNYSIKTGNPKQISDLLKLCDYGIILRDDSLVNQVASPVKVAEYMASGLSILYAGKLGDYPEIIQKHNIGYDIKENSIVELVKIMNDTHNNIELRNKIINLCCSYFTWNSNKNIIEDIFK